jgi:hypothetical protein
MSGQHSDGAVAENYDAIISFLCRFLHIPDRVKLFAACRAALKPEGVMYIEDLKVAALVADEAEGVVGESPVRALPGKVEYETQLVIGGAFPM